MSLFVGYAIGYLRGKGRPGFIEVAGGTLLFAASLSAFLLI